MKKFINEWKVFFGSMNAPKFNIYGICLFLLNACLCTFRAYETIQIKTDLYNWSYGSLWLFCSYIFFMRIFFNRGVPRFARTLPCTKKLYTRNISVLFELLNTLTLVIGIVLWIILYGSATEKTNLECFPIMFFLSCVMHLVYSIFIPFTSTVIRRENNPNMKGTGSGTFFNFFILYFYGVSVIMVVALTFLMKMLIANEMYLFVKGNAVFFLICGVIILASWIINRMVFCRLYERE